MIKNKNIFKHTSFLSTVCLTIAFVILLVALFVLDFIPLRYRIVVFLLSIAFSMGILLITKKALWRYTLAICLIIVSGGLYASKEILGGISKPSSVEYVEYRYVEMPDKNLYEPKNVIGYYGVNWAKASAALEEQNSLYVQNKVVLYNDPSKLVYDILNNYIDGAIIQSSFLTDLTSIDDDFLETVITINTFKIEFTREITEKNVDINKENFAILVSGVDVYGDVLTRARSDMNMVLYINPKEKEVLMVSIPRDTYTPLGCESGEMDKLTHSSLYGIDCTINTLEMLLGNEINYYARINFTGLIELVDAIDGVDVSSHYSFTTDSGFTFTEGLNHVDGRAALAFARERNHLEYGDVSRGVHHQELMMAILNKVTDAQNIVKLPQVAMLLQNIVDTNLDNTAISSFISSKLDGDTSWSVTPMNLEGRGDMQPVYSLGDQYKYYVYWPNYDSLNAIKEAIKTLIGG